MRQGNSHQSFPGADRRTSDRLASEVAADEQATVMAIRELRENGGVSLEALGFLLGAEAAQLSRHLKGACGTSLVNYLRIARALGYRCRVVFEKAESIDRDAEALSSLTISPIKVLNARSTSVK
jgi:hypothetical protein